MRLSPMFVRSISRPVAILFISITLLISGCDLNKFESAEEYILSAEQKINQEEHVSAVIDLKNALELEPDNTRARWLLGEEYLILGDFASARAAYLKAKKNGVDENAVLPRIVEALYYAGEFEEVLEFVVENDLLASTRADIHAIKSLAYLSKGKKNDALREVSSSISLAGDQLLSLYASASLNVREGKLEEALGNINKALEIDPTFVRGTQLLGDIYYKHRKWELADDAYSKSVSDSHYVGTPHIKQAHLYLVIKKYELAEQAIKKIRDAGISASTVEYIDGVLALRRGDPETARTFFDKALEYEPNHLMSQYFLAVSYRNTDSSLAVDFAERVVAKAPGFIPGRVLLASIKMASQDYSTVEKLLLPIYKRRPQAPGVANMLYMNYLKQGDFDNATRILQALTEQKQDTREHMIRLGVAQMSAGRAPQAIDTFTLLKKEDSTNNQVITRLAQAQVLAGIGEQAIETAREWVADNPNLASAQNLLGLVLLAVDKTTESEQALRKAVDLDGDGSSGAALNLARLMLAQNRKAEASDVVEQFEGKFGGSPDTKLMLANIAIADNQNDRAAVYLDEALQISPNHTKIRAMLAELYLKSSKHSQALEVITPMGDAGKHKADVKLLMARVLFANNRYDSTVSILEQLKKINPKLIQARLLLLQAYARQGRLDEYENELNLLLEVTPDSEFLRKEKTKLLVQTGRITEAKKVADSLNLDESNPLRLAIDARVAFASEEFDKAVLMGRKLLDTAPSDSDALFLIRAVSASGDKVAAENLAKEWSTKSPGNIVLLIELANIQHGLDKTTEFQETLRTILVQDPNNSYALNGLAWELKDEDPVKALDFSQRAVLYAPETVSVLDTLANVQLANGLSNEALDTALRGKEMSRNYPPVRLTLAKIFLALDRQEDANNELEWLMGQDVSDELKREASQLRTQ
ncbi:MAG: XrtA/PEP-CTERM system TPR-repeat protein PrsT [Sedimenticola sp.]